MECGTQFEGPDLLPCCQRIRVWQQGLDGLYLARYLFALMANLHAAFVDWFEQLRATSQRVAEGRNDINSPDRREY